MAALNKEQIVENILIDNYRKYYCLAFSYVHNEADALDIVQEGAYKAILKSDTLRNEEYAATWIYRIMLNEIFGFCRSRKASPLEDEMTGGSLLMSYDNSAGCADEIDLYNALEKLSEEERRILQLRFFQGLRLDEVSEVMGIKLSTVKSKLYRAIEKLRLSMSA